MEWDDNEATEEFGWLSFMAAYKYDGYRDYCAGARFVESFATWLQQFAPDDRPAAYHFVKEQLIYFNPREIERLVEKLIPEIVQGHLVQQVANALAISPYQVWSSPESESAYSLELRQTLFMGLSDGARIDVLRRMNSGVISNEQVVVATQIDVAKWFNLVKDLRVELEKRGCKNHRGARFNSVYLIDDFTGSGTSLLPDPDIVLALKGKLVKFLNSVQAAEEKLGDARPFSEGLQVYVHHYIGTAEAKRRIDRVYAKVKPRLEKEYGVTSVHFSYGMLLPDDIVIDERSADPFATLCKKYYDDAIEGDGEHGNQSGYSGRMFGYANCGLPVVLEHNTPNNSLSILHTRTDLENGQHNMRPLFYRRERHSDLVQVEIPVAKGDQSD